MALVRLRPRYGRSFNNDEGGTEYAYKFWGYSNNRADTMFDILSDPLLPRRYQRDDADPRARFVSVSAVHAGIAKTIWDISAVSSTKIDEEEQDENPLARPAEYDWRGTIEEVAALVNSKGEPHVNKAGDYFEGATRKRPAAVLSVYKNIPPVGASWLLTHLAKTNRGSIKLDGLPFRQGRLMFTGVSLPKPERENDIRFRGATLEFTYNPDGWAVENLNRGLREVKSVEVLNEETGEVETIYKKVEILDDDGKPITEPVFLDAEGKAIRAIDDDGRERLKHPIEKSEIITIKDEIERINFSKLPLK